MPIAPSPREDSDLAYAEGDVIASKYLLEELLGEGGMGAVFRARNTVLDMPVAIKLIRADLNRELLSGRLMQEARAAAKLSHPAIVRVFDVGQTAHGNPFIVMELLEGENLSAIIEREGRLTAIRAVQVLLPIADALAAAHAKGFVHRDVKPDNVFVVMDEGTLQPKLVDFGIVKLDRRDGNNQLTQMGAVLGSPDYMSPEQARGLDDIDLRSDVWSFSILLYEAITGATPFESDNYNALLRMIQETEPPTLKELSAADAELSKIIARGMSKDRAGRYPSLGQMGKALAAWLVDQGIADDACGVTLESKWLTRQTDPVAAGRSSRPSLPDWIEPTSGIRNVRRSFGEAPTIGVSSSETPAPTRASARPLFIAAAAVLLGLPIAWLVVAPSKPRAERAAAASAAAPEAHVAGQRPTPASPLPTLVPSDSPSVLPTKALADGESADTKPRGAVGAAPRVEPAPQPAPSSAAPPVTEAPPKTDLIAPY